MKYDKLKARVRDYETIRREAEDLTGGPPQIVYQDERYYNVPEGRLKMRFWPDNTGTLLRYDKDVPNAVALKKLITEKDSLKLDLNADEARELHVILASAFGNLGRVLKERHQYRRDNTMIYIDTVQDLGQFVKVVVPVMPEWSYLDCQIVLRDLLIELKVTNDQDHIPDNYIDMLNGNS